jgi:DNA polymerase III subunit beta
MKVTLRTPLLLEAVGHAASVASAKSPNPVLECVSLRAQRGKGLALEATDLDVGVALTLADADVSEEGTLVVPAARLLAILREVDQEEVTLSEVDGSLAIQSGRSHFRVRGEDARNVAELATFPGSGGVTLPAAELRAMIRRTVFATAKEAGRFALHGVLFRVAGKTLELVATDGRRLARATHPLPQSAAKEVKVIVGPKALLLLERVVGDETANVGLALHERQVMFRVGHAVIVSRLIDGTFPVYEDVIPKASPKSFEAEAGALATALRRASLLTTREAMSVQVDVARDLVTLRSRAAEVGEAKVELPVTYDGPGERMGFNPGFLLEALKVMEPQAKVRFEFSNAKAPGKLTDGDDYVYVVMPIALE